MKRTLEILIIVAYVIIFAVFAFKLRDVGTTHNVEQTVTEEPPAISPEIYEEIVNGISSATQQRDQDEHKAEEPQEEPEYDYIPSGRYDSIELTNYERGLLAMTLYREARGEPYEGQHAVMEIILNRYITSFDGKKSLEDIIYAKKQFSVAKDLTTRPVTELGALSFAFDIVDEVLETRDYQVKDYYMYFGKKKPNTVDYIKIGNHYFY